MVSVKTNIGATCLDKDFFLPAWYNPGMKSQLTTLCYIEKNGSYLMLHRVKKQNDINQDKWIGVGGHFEHQESPEDCLLREVKEETGLTLKNFNFRGIVTFVSDGEPAEYMCLYTSDSFEGELTDCAEGTLEWVPFEKIESLELWEGDKIFLRLLHTDAPFFSLKLVYKDGKLTEKYLDSKPI
ncbi:8-oxo-dGTP diphosphatase [Treponema berlinense]|uniref:8-oxo-dGTP diphosphatase n=2 Tax=Treponema berlinense TaxID=225004 RepID=A0A1T4Q9M2_9SPIR|nr:8-oxo-dGTP diphosphatase [Treponema berlinense]